MLTLHTGSLLLQMSHVAWSACLSGCVCVLITREGFAEPIEMPLWELTQVCSCIRWRWL